jgi:two-component sensor histidine kinase
MTERQLDLIAAENRVLARIAADEPLGATLDLLARSIEEYVGGTMLASVLLMDEDGLHLRHGAAPSLPSEYTEAIDGSEIGPAQGSCGTAAFRKEPVYVTDIESDPLWQDYRHLARPHGLVACWSTPFLSQSGAVLGTFALYHREPRPPGQREKEMVDLFVKTATLAIERHRAREQQQLLVDEMAHRVKNTLAVVRAIAGSTLRGHCEPESYRAFENRLIALSKTQGILVETDWSGSDVHGLVRAVAVTPFTGNAARFVLSGPRVPLAAQVTLPFALALHELSTNAAKYGALSTDRGRVEIDWSFDEGEKDVRIFRFGWSEAEGPAVTTPDRQGFGSRVIRQAFASVPGSEVAIQYRPEGLRCLFLAPADQVVAEAIADRSR